MKKFDRKQTTFEGPTVTEEQAKDALLGTPDYLVICPFCFKESHLRECRLFNQEGTLLKMLKCPSCNRKMQFSSMHQVSDPWMFGMWVGYYPYFWRSVDHDSWIAGLKRVYGGDRNRLKRFWDSYAEARPKFKEQRELEQKTREYESSFSEEGGVNSGTMGKVKDLITQLDWENVPSHIIEYDPNMETETEEGRNGPFDVIKVKEDGVTYYLSLSNQSLLRQLRKFDKPTRLKVTREGVSFATKYKVEAAR